MSAASFAPSRLFGRSSESLERRVLFNAFVVDTLDDTSLPDDGVVSLREAVQLANTSPGDDRILFAGDVRGTITLTGGQLDVTDASGSLTIEGPGAAALSVSGNGATRVIQIGAAASADISGLTITAGRADTGGGISTADGTFTVTRCTFDGNQATGPIGKGGAIYTKNGSVIVIGCTFSGNSADQSGGGIHSEAINSPRPTILSVADSSFLSNLAVGGGGISTVYPSTFSTCTVTNTTFDANRASSFGGAINGGGTIAGCTFVGNTAGQTAGAIWQSSGPSTSITESTFIANDPAAVVMVDAGRTTISSSTFRNNPGGAAGISLTHATITGCVFDSNGLGAVSASESTVNIEGTTFLNNRNPGRGGGGAMSLYSCSGTLENISVIGNQAVGNGGGIQLYNSRFSINNSRFEFNRVEGVSGPPGGNGLAGSNGGSAVGGALAVDTESRSPTITGTIFIGNTATGGDGGVGGTGGNGGKGGDATGGAIANRGFGAGALSGCTFINNRALAGKGGDAGAGATAGNGGNASGGGLFGIPYYAGSSGTLSGCTIAGNAAIGGSGGNAPSGKIAGNGGNAYGGGFAVFPFARLGSIARCTLLANLALGGTGGTALSGGARGAGGNAFGGGFYSPGFSAYDAQHLPFSVSASRIIRNRAIGGDGAPDGPGQGGGIYTTEQIVTLDSATRVTGNYASGGFDDLFGPVVRRRPDALLRSLAVRQV